MTLRLGRTVLVIDDEPDMLTLARMGLELMEGWRVLTAVSPAEGLRTAAAEQPDVILLDMTFPATDGVQVLAELRAQEATRSIPVLLVSGTLAGAAVAELGVAGIVQKPFDVTQLGPYVASRLGWAF